jgi:hypothetical protein
MRRLLAVTCAAVAAGCGGSGQATFDSGQVERAFLEQGIALKRLSSTGAEQTAMGTTSPCATVYLGFTDSRAVFVWVCDSATEVRKLPHPEQEAVRANVVVDYGGRSEAIRSRVQRALDGLD